MSFPRSPGSSYPDSTKATIIRFVHDNPGRKGREIAESLGLEKSHVNSFLYGEGKRKHGLSEYEWRWYPYSDLQRSLQDESYSTREKLQRSVPISTTPVRSRKDIPEISICGKLSEMSRSDATIKIRGMSLQAVELAFQEDEYAQLDDYLQAELATRLKLLRSALEKKPDQSVNWLPYVIGLFIIILLIRLFT